MKKPGIIFPKIRVLMMMTARKQLIAQIAMTNRILCQKQSQVAESQEYFRQEHLNYSGLWAAVIIIPALWLGWKMSGEKWVERTATQFVELVTFAGLTYFRRKIMGLFIK